MLFDTFVTALFYALSVFVTVLSVTPPPYFRNALSPTPTGEFEDMDFRVPIPAGKVECFFQDAKRDHTLEVAFTVIEISSRFQWLSPSGKSDLTIDFTVTSPENMIVAAEKRRTEGTHAIPVTRDGTYKICLDNSFSTVSTKLVNLEVYLFSDNDDDRWQSIQDAYTFAPEIKYEESVESIRSSMNRVRDNLIKVVHSQNEWRSIENRDRTIAESNFEFINRFSIISIFVFMIVAITQLFVIRSLFEDKNFVKDMMRKVESRVTGSRF